VQVVSSHFTPQRELHLFGGTLYCHSHYLRVPSRLYIFHNSYADLCVSSEMIPTFSKVTKTTPASQEATVVTFFWRHHRSMPYPACSLLTRVAVHYLGLKLIWVGTRPTARVAVHTASRLGFRPPNLLDATRVEPEPGSTNKRKGRPGSFLFLNDAPISNFFSFLHSYFRKNKKWSRNYPPLLHLPFQRLSA